jgi:hypothetical protein
VVDQFVSVAEVSEQSVYTRDVLYKYVGSNGGHALAAEVVLRADIEHGMLLNTINTLEDISDAGTDLTDEQVT